MASVNEANLGMNRKTTIRAAWICAGALALASAVGRAAHPLVTPDAGQEPTAVYKVRAVDASGRVNNGSAVLIAPGKLVTTCHVTRSATSIHVDQGKGAWAARTYFADIPHDLCILSVPSLEAQPPAEIGATDALKVGEEVVAVGYRHGRKLAVTSGKVKALHPYHRAVVLQVSAPFEHGQSGGALFDRRGRLVGITAFKAVAGGDFHFALPLEWLPDQALRDDAVGSAQQAHQRAFWEYPREDQPLFLRAASLEAAGRWEALSEVAQEWVRADYANPASWLALSRAFAKLNRAADAAAAYRRAAGLEQPAAELR
jgi:hypothetical protein